MEVVFKLYSLPAEPHGSQIMVVDKGSVMGPGWDSHILHDNDFHLCSLWLFGKCLGTF